MGCKISFTEIESMKAVLELSYLCTFPMAVKAAILLNVPEILSAESDPMTAKQITDRIPVMNTSHTKLERLLKALATYGLFQVSGSDPPTFGLTGISRLLAKDENGVSLASLFLLNTDPSYLHTLHFLHEAVLQDGLVPFDKAYGKPLFHYISSENSQLGEIFHSAMTNLSALSMKTVLMSYSGFKDVKVLVDVGGGTGRNCVMIKAAYPHIYPINFDMPFVIAKASELPGIEHRGGSMFESVPSDGDAILLKKVLHNWDDAGCAKILSNCYSALPTSGKLIMVEVVLPEEVDTSVTSRLAASSDLTMMNSFKGGKERTIAEFQYLLNSTGFNNFKVVVNEDVFCVIEASKI